MNKKKIDVPKIKTPNLQQKQGDEYIPGKNPKKRKDPNTESPEKELPPTDKNKNNSPIGDPNSIDKNQRK